MRPYSKLGASAWLAALVFAGGAVGEEYSPLERRVYGLLSGFVPGGHRELMKLGEKAFPAYERLLKDPEMHPRMVGLTLCIIGDVEADRRRFRKPVVSHLADKDFGVRLNAVILLQDIGGPAECSPVVALLSDKRVEIISEAAATLAAIGGPKELAALDAWLRGDSHRDAADVRRSVRDCRDELKERLEDAKDPRKRARQIAAWWMDLRDRETVSPHFTTPQAQRAVRDLTAYGNETVAFLRHRVRPVPATTQKHLDQLLADLGGDDFARREAAERELLRGVVADSVLRKALADSPPLELRRRLEAVLEDLPQWTTRSPERLRQIRAVWVLQQIGTPEARSLLEKIAAGAPSARLTQKAKSALESLEQVKKR